MSPYINASGIGIYHLIFYANGTNAIGCEFNGTNILNATHSGFGMSSLMPLAFIFEYIVIDATSIHN
jgi:hypothetical protein